MGGETRHKPKDENLEELPRELMESWQQIIDLLAQIVKVPAGLIMRLKQPYIEVCVASKNKDNPYKVGDKEFFDNSGLYCEHVINTRQKLLVPNALNDKGWKSNPDIKLNMVSYLGFPVSLPDGTPFGTICVLDKKENSYSLLVETLMLQFKKIIEGNLAILHMNRELGEKNKRLADFIDEIKILRELIPICSSCKKIREDDGFWNSVDTYLEQHGNLKFTHGLCPECTEKLYSDQDWYAGLQNKADSDDSDIT